MMVMLVFFSDFEAVCVEVLPLGMRLLYFLGCWLVPVITDFSYWLLLKYERAPDPLRGSRGDGHGTRLLVGPFFMHRGFVHVGLHFPQKVAV